MDDHRKHVRNQHVGLACQLQVPFIRSNAVVTDRPGEPGYGDSYILDPEGCAVVEAGLFKTGLITATVSPAAYSYLTAPPDWLKEEVGRLVKDPPDRSTTANQD